MHFKNLLSIEPTSVGTKIYIFLSTSDSQRVTKATMLINQQTTTPDIVRGLQLIGNYTNYASMANLRLP